jgi:C-terminal processing protease CtpA/Prc
MDQSWDETLTAFIPQFILSDKMISYQHSVRELAAHLNDGHAYISIRDVRSHTVSMELTLIEDNTVIKGCPDLSLFQRGDIISHIDGRCTKCFRDSISEITPGSTQLQKDDRINRSLIFELPFHSVITVERNHQTIQIPTTNTLLNYKKQPLPKYEKIANNIGFINFLTDADIAHVMGDLENTKGIIFDLRNDLRDFREKELFTYLSSKEVLECFWFIESDLFHPGAFEIDTQSAGHIIRNKTELNGHKKYKGEVIVLIDESTASWGETRVGLFKAIDAVLIGRPTGGSNGNATVLLLPGKITAHFSGIGVTDFRGKELQRKGFIPDIEVYPTMESIKAGKDEILERAISYLDNK